MNSPRYAIRPYFYRRWWFQMTLLFIVAVLVAVLLIQTL